MSGIFARIVAMIGGVTVLMRREGERGHEPAFGGAPTIPEAKPQAIPTLKLPTARGWDPGQTPTVAPGLSVNAFAKNLEHPRWIHVLPNGDVLVAEAQPGGGKPSSLFDRAMQATLLRAGARGKSANRISLWRDEDGDGVAEVRKIFLEGQNLPFGMALVGDRFFVGNTDGIVAFALCRGGEPYRGARRKAGGFQTRWPLDPKPFGQPRWAKALCRRWLAQQYRR